MDIEKTPPSYDSWEVCTELLERLPSLGPAERAEAVFRLLRNPTPGIRLRALRVGAALLPESWMAGCLRESADDILRNAGLEMLKLRGQSALPLAVELLRDPDSDVILQAVLLLDHYRDPRAVEPLRSMLGHPDLNVVQATITALGRLGDSRIVPDLVPFLKGDAWLQIAAIQALGDLKAPSGARKLEALLPDLFAGPFVAEALARMGGAAALKALANNWVRCGEQVDPDSYLGFMTHVACGLKILPPLPAEFLESLAERTATESSSTRRAAASCLLAMGPSAWDQPALDILCTRAEEAAEIPTCLHRRRDLCAALLRMNGSAGDWGLALAAEGAELDEESLKVALCGEVAPSDLEAVSQVAKRKKFAWLGTALADLYFRAGEPDQIALLPALKAHAASVLDCARAKGVPAVELLVLEGRLGEKVRRVAEGLESLRDSERLEVLRRLGGESALVRKLPWKLWIAASPLPYGKALARAAVASRWPAAAELIRPLLAQAAEPEFLRALGELGDRASIPWIAAALGDERPLIRIQAMESLGRIGDPASRRALKEILHRTVEGERRALYRALASSATEEEVPLFRAAVADPDWMVRLACVEVLARFPTVENLAALCGLASDPSAAVAHKAQAALEP